MHTGTVIKIYKHSFLSAINNIKVSLLYFKRNILMTLEWYCSILQYIAFHYYNLVVSYVWSSYRAFNFLMLLLTYTVQDRAPYLAQSRKSDRTVIQIPVMPVHASFSDLC